LAKLHDAIVPAQHQLGSARWISQKFWNTFLAACLLFDPPETELIEFANLGPLPPVGFVNLPRAKVDIETWTVGSVPDAPIMVNPPVLSQPDPEALLERERWLWGAVFTELGRRYLAPQGLDVDGVIEEILDDLGLLEQYTARSATVPLRKLIPVEPSTTQEDVRRAFQMLAATQPERGKGGRPSIDPLVAVQCAIWKRSGWTDPVIAERFGWSLRSDSYERKRRSNQVIDHVKRGNEILAGRKNPAE